MMYRCKMFTDSAPYYLEALLSEWFDEMKNTPMYNVEFHYAVNKGVYSVLVTYRVEGEE